jgi:hypothetical protein
VLIGGVIGDQVDDEPHMSLLDTGEHGVEVVHRPELGHDFAVIANVVAIVSIGRVEVRAQPDDVDSELLEIVEM